MTGSKEMKITMKKKMNLKQDIKEKYEEKAGAPLKGVDRKTLQMSTVLVFENGETIEVDDEQFQFMIEHNDGE